jgi:hypothetical protein
VGDPRGHGDSLDRRAPSINYSLRRAGSSLPGTAVTMHDEATRERSYVRRAAGRARRAGHALVARRQVVLQTRRTPRHEG